MGKNEITSAQDIRELATAFQKSRILLTGFELDIFTILEGHLLSSADVAKRISTDERATNRLMNALTALGFLRKTKGKFYNSEHSEQFLVKGKPEYMGNLFHTNHLWKTWSSLTDVVRKGGTLRKEEINERGDDWLEAFIAAMHYRGVGQAKILSMMLDLTDVNKILDVGGGSGAFAMGLLINNKNAEVVIFDLPNVIPITKKYVESEGMLDRIIFISGDFMEDDLGSGYDLILLSAIVHMNSYEENKQLIKKCYDSLNEKGQIIIQDFIMSDDRINPPHGAMFAINMLVGTKSGDTYTAKEMEEWYNSAGIKEVEMKETGFGSNLMIGYKR